MGCLGKVGELSDGLLLSVAVRRHGGMAVVGLARLGDFEGQGWAP